MNFQLIGLFFFVIHVGLVVGFVNTASRRGVQTLIQGPRTIPSPDTSPVSRQVTISLSSDKVDGNIVQSALSKASSFTASTPYSLIEAAIVFTLLSAVDGGFSGDWSDYGLISLEQEDWIKAAITLVGEFHILCAGVAYTITKQRNQPTVPAVLHTMLIGGLGLLRVLLQTEETKVDFPSFSAAAFKQLITAKIAGDYDADIINKRIDSLIAKNNCLMFSLSGCPYCKKAKELMINELGASVTVVELDVEEKLNNYPIRAELGKRTGQTSCPSIWLRGEFLGGCNDGGMGGVATLHAQNKLVPMLLKAKAIKATV